MAQWELRVALPFFMGILFNTHALFCLPSTDYRLTDPSALTGTSPNSGEECWEFWEYYDY